MLTEQQRAILDVESRFWRHAGVKEDHVREHLGLTPLAYYQRLNALLDQPEALAYAPAVVNRLRSLRSRRGRRRAA